MEDIFEEIDTFLYKHKRFRVKTISASYVCPYCKVTQVFIKTEHEVEISEREFIENQFQIDTRYYPKCSKCEHSAEVALILDLLENRVLFYVVTTTIKKEEKTGKYRVSPVNVKFVCEECNRESWHYFTENDLIVFKQGSQTSVENLGMVECPHCETTQEVVFKFKPETGFVEIVV